MTSLEISNADPALPNHHVIVWFGSGIPADAQGRMMLAAEKMLREMGLPAEVYKESAPDDSKLRSSMTAEKRKRL